MLSIRSQNRMALVPYKSMIEIKCNTYKVVNKKEIKDVKTFNNNLMKKLRYELEYGNDKNLLKVLVDMVSLNKMYKEQKKEEPKEIYNEWYIRDYEIGTSLGTYKTKERALEILDEIQDATKNVEGISLVQPLITVATIFPMIAKIIVEIVEDDNYEELVDKQIKILNEQLGKTLKDIDKSLVYEMPVD